MPSPAFDQFAAIRQIGAAAYSPDGTRLAYLASTSGRMELWTMPAGGGFPVQLTHHSDRRVQAFRWSPDGRRIAFLADRHGDELPELYVLDVREDGASWPRQLTDLPTAQVNLAGWTPDGRHVVATANDREPGEMDPLLVDADSGAIDRLLTGGMYYAGPVSPDGRRLVVLEFHGNTDQDLHVLDLETREMTLATPHEGQAIHFPGPWARDGSGFYLLTDHGREFRGLAFYGLERGAWGWAHAPEHDVEEFALAEDGRTTLAAVNVDGAHRLQSWDLEGDREIPVPELPLGVAEAIALHPSERRAVVTWHTPREAANLWELDLGGGGARRLEQSMLGGIRPADLREPELVRYGSFDRDIPAWLYRPAGDGPHPVVVSIHGGPEWQERPAYKYHGLYQFLLERGIAVLAPNIRGSTGYGISYQKLIHRDWGGGELRDIDHAARWLKEQPWVDPARLAVFGGSFGGFATLSALTRLPEHWAAGVSIVGPSNLVTFAKSVPPHWRPFMAALVGDPEADREELLERSPITHVDRVQAPLLVIQGANDPRVVQAESDQMVEKMRERGLEVEYLVDETSGHGAADRAASLRWYRKVAEFLTEKLSVEEERAAAD